MKGSDIRQAKQAAVAAQRSKHKWEPITPFREFKLPPFPLHTLPDILRQWVKATAEATQTPSDMAAILALSAVAAACQRKIEIEPKPGYIEQLSVYAVVALDPGNRKSSIFRVATKPLYDYEREQRLRMADAIAISENEYKIMKKRVAKAQHEAAEADDEDREGKINLANELAVEFSKMKPVVAPRYIVDDATTEKLVSLLSEHDEKIAMFSAEGDIFSVMAGRYDTKGEPNFGIYLKGHVGDPMVYDRVNGRSGYLESPALTIALTVQLGVLKDISRTRQFSERGLVARIWYLLPHSPVGTRKILTESIPDHVESAYHNLLTSLLAIPAEKNPASGKINPHRICLSPEARTIFVNYFDKVESKLAPYGTYSDISFWASKLVGSVVRIAGLLHLATHGTNDDQQWRTPVSTDTLELAIEIGEYLVAHARAAHGLMASDPVVEEAKYLIGWINKIGKPFFTKRDLHRRVRGRLQKTNELEPPLLLLIEHGYLREFQQEKQGIGQKPSPLLYVHPDLLKESGHNGQNNDEVANPVHSGHKKAEKNNEKTSEHQSPLYFEFPLYGKEHQHEFAVVEHQAGAAMRCKLCGEFPPKT